MLGTAGAAADPTVETSDLFTAHGAAQVDALDMQRSTTHRQMFASKRQRISKRLTATDVSQYVGRNCERELRLRSMTETEWEDNGIQTSNPDKNTHVRERFMRGQRFEARMVQKLEAVRGIAVVNLTRKNERFVADTFVDLTNPTVLVQTPLDLDQDHFPGEQKSSHEVGLAVCIPDFIFVDRTVDHLRMLIVDAKSSKHIKLQHQVQCAVYIIVLREFIQKHRINEAREQAGLLPLRVPDIAGVWTPDSNSNVTGPDGLVAAAACVASSAANPTPAGSSNPWKVSDGPLFQYIPVIVERTANFLAHTLPRIVSDNLHNNEWHLNSGCISCKFQPHCRSQAMGKFVPKRNTRGLDWSKRPTIAQLAYVSKTEMDHLTNVFRTSGAYVPNQWQNDTAGSNLPLDAVDRLICKCSKWDSQQGWIFDADAVDQARLTLSQRDYTSIRHMLGGIVSATDEEVDLWGETKQAATPQAISLARRAADSRRVQVRHGVKSIDFPNSEDCRLVIDVRQDPAAHTNRMYAFGIQVFMDDMSQIRKRMFTSSYLRRRLKHWIHKSCSKLYEKKLADAAAPGATPVPAATKQKWQTRLEQLQQECELIREGMRFTLLAAADRYRNIRKLMEKREANPTMLKDAIVHAATPAHADSSDSDLLPLSDEQIRSVNCHFVETLHAVLKELSLDKNDITKCVRLGIFIFDKVQEAVVTDVLLHTALSDPPSLGPNAAPQDVVQARAAHERLQSKAVDVLLTVCSAGDMLLSPEQAEIVDGYQTPKILPSKQKAEAAAGNLGIPQAFLMLWDNVHNVIYYDMRRQQTNTPNTADIATILSSRPPTGSATPNSKSMIGADKWWDQYLAAPQQLRQHRFTQRQQRRRQAGYWLTVVHAYECLQFILKLPADVRNLTEADFKRRLGGAGDLSKQVLQRTTQLNAQQRARQRARTRQGIAIVESFLHRHFYLPDPGYYTFADVLHRCMSAADRQQRFPGQAATVKSRMRALNDERMHTAWAKNSGFKEKLRDRLHYLSEDLVQRYRKKIWGVQRTIRDPDLRPQLMYPAGNFQLFTRADIKFPLLKQAYFIAQHEVLVDYADMQRQRTSLPLNQMMLEGHAVVLQTTGDLPDPCFERDNTGQLKKRRNGAPKPAVKDERLCHFYLRPECEDVTLPVSTNGGLMAWMLHPHTPEGIRNAQRFEDINSMDRTYYGGFCSVVHFDYDTQAQRHCVTLRVKGWKKPDGTLEFPFTDGHSKPALEFVLHKRFTNWTFKKLKKEIVRIDEKLEQGQRDRFVDIIQNPSLQLPLNRPIDAELDLIEHAMSNRLADSQMRALRKVLREAIVTIWGPPGAGKTFVLANIILLTVFAHRTQNQPPFRVYVTSSTNSAIDTLLEKIAELCGQNSFFETFFQSHGGQRPLIVRVLGDGDKQTERHKDLGIQVAGPKTIPKLTDVPSGSAIIYGGTPWKLNTHFRKRCEEFDLVVIDEASQLPVGHAAAPMSALATNSARLVIAGDHKQLPPIIKAEYPEPACGKARLHGSLLEAMLRSTAPHIDIAPFDPAFDRADIQRGTVPAHNIRLEENYRMNHQLATFTEYIYGTFRSQCDYQIRDHLHDEAEWVLAGELKEDLQDQEIQSFDLAAKRASLRHLLLHEESITRIQFHAGDAAQRYTAHKTAAVEAVAVAEAVRSFVENFCPDPAAPNDSALNHVLIVTPHHEQRLAVEQRIRKFFPNDISRIFINTAEKAQGKTALLVIICCSVFSQAQMRRDTEFMLAFPRLNVALSRARAKIIIVCGTALSDAPLHLMGDEEVRQGFLMYTRALKAAEGASLDWHLE